MANSKSEPNRMDTPVLIVWLFVVLSLLAPHGGITWQMIQQQLVSNVVWKNPWMRCNVKLNGTPCWENVCICVCKNEPTIEKQNHQFVVWWSMTRTWWTDRVDRVGCPTSEASLMIEKIFMWNGQLWKDWHCGIIAWMIDPWKNAAQSELFTFLLATIHIWNPFFEPTIAQFHEFKFT